MTEGQLLLLIAAVLLTPIVFAGVWLAFVALMYSLVYRWFKRL